MFLLLSSICGWTMVQTHIPSIAVHGSQIINLSALWTTQQTCTDDILISYRVGSHVVLLGYTVRMFEYTVRTFWLNIGRFLYFFSSIPRKLYTIFQPTFSPIKRYQDSIFKLLTLGTNSVTNVVRTAYFLI